MRLSLPVVLIMAFLAMLMSTGCPGGSTPAPADNPTPADTPDPADEPENEEIIDVPSDDLTGTDPELMLTTWDEMGEETEDVKFWVEDFEGGYVDIESWIITDLTIDEFYEVEYDLPAGNWDVTAWGGLGCVDLDMYAYGPGGEDDILGEDELTDNFPMIFLYLDEPTTVTFKIWPYEVEDESKAINVLWYLEKAED